VKLFEKETGSVMRAVDFVFRTSAGVNRPLTPSDNPDKNLNKTFYRDQINKTANAIKEIIQGLKTEPGFAHVKDETKLKESIEEANVDEKRIENAKPEVLSKSGLIAGIAIIGILIITAIIANPKLFKKDSLKNLISSDGKISVAVMPFQNLTNDTIWNNEQYWIQDILITSLLNSKELKVRPSELINTYFESKGLTNYASITPVIASKISQKLNANVCIYGSVLKEGTKIRLNAQLINSKTKEALQSFQIDGADEEIMDISDSLSVMIKNYFIRSVMEKEIPKDFHQLISTRSPDAYRYYRYGNKAFYKYDFDLASECFKRAIDFDSSFTEAIRMYAYS
jgi:TolB-like protein